MGNGVASRFCGASACRSENDDVATRASPCSVPRMRLALHVEADANFDNQRRLIAYAPILQPVCVVRGPHGSVFSPAPTGTVRSFLPTWTIVTKHVEQ